MPKRFSKSPHPQILAQKWLLSVRHSWSQKLELHPLALRGAAVDFLPIARVDQPRNAFFLPVKVLSSVFSRQVRRTLKRAFQNGQLCSTETAAFAQPKNFAAWLRPLFRKDWVVIAKPPFGSPEACAPYLGRYPSLAISIIDWSRLADGKVTFRRRSAHNNEQKLIDPVAR